MTEYYISDYSSKMFEVYDDPYAIDDITYIVDNINYNSKYFEAYIEQSDDGSVAWLRIKPSIDTGYDKKEDTVLEYAVHIAYPDYPYNEVTESMVLKSVYEDQDIYEPEELLDKIYDTEHEIMMDLESVVKELGTTL